MSKSNTGNHSGEQRAAGYDALHVQATVKLAEQELRDLMRQRAEVAERIGTIRTTISGLSLLFGVELPDDSRELAQSGSKSQRRLGRTVSGESARTIEKSIAPPAVG